jgi:hypothetical protein
MTILFTSISFGQVAGFAGGVKDDYTYKEMLFITGEPIQVEGTVNIRERQKGNTVTTTYTYDLKNIDKNVTLKRRVSFVTNQLQKPEKHQTIDTTTLDRYSERITAGSDRYNLEDYQFSRSIVHDNRPAVDFYSGNLSGKKTYSININQGTVTVDTKGDTIVGYKHHWGASETYILTQDINSEKNTVYTDVYGKQQTENAKWDGMVTLKLSSTDKKDFTYIENKPTNISFRGGLLQTEKQENIVQYDYDLPTFDDNGIPDNRDRNKDEGNIRMDTLPTQKRLVLPNLKDIQGHWAEESIFTLYSIEVFDDPSPYFGPGLPMTRGEFAKAVVRAISDIGNTQTTTNNRTVNRNQNTQPAAIFQDIKSDDDMYKYVKFVKDNGIMNGISSDFFSPEGVLTRAQAVTILIRSLGLQDLAPSPPYKTQYTDDDKIPLWAKDSIYVASEIGLLKGDPYGRVNPNAPMTKAEAATFIYRFIQHIKDEITVDYRERLINSY